MMQKTTALYIWCAAAVLALAACSKDTPATDIKYDGEIRISAVSDGVVDISSTRADNRVELARFGIPAEKLTAEWIMANMHTRVQCVEMSGDEEDMNNDVAYPSANDFNKANPRLSPVNSIFGISLCTAFGDGSELPDYTTRDGETVENMNAAEYRHEHPAEKLIPDVPEGEGADFVYFEGHEEVLLEPKSHKDVEVTVRVANTVVSVEFTEAFRSYFGNGATVTLTTKNGFTAEAAAYTAETADEQTADKYFWVQPQSFTLSATAARQSPSPGIFDADIRRLDDYTVADPAPQTWYRCVYDVTNVGNTSTGTHGGITVTLNGEPVYTEDLGDEEMNPNAPDAPQD